MPIIIQPTSWSAGYGGLCTHSIMMLGTVLTVWALTS